MYRSTVVGLLSGSVVLAGMTQAISQQICRPSLAITEVHFSEMQQPTLERKWTAVVTVDASRCAANSGKFEIGFTRLKEIGPDLDFWQHFAWLQPSINVSVDFAADEAVAQFWIDNVAPCPCRR